MTFKEFVRDKIVNSLLGFLDLRLVRKSNYIVGPYMVHLIHACQVVDRRFTGPIHAIEIGTIRSRDEGTLSTLHMIRNLKPGSHVLSVDISPEAIGISKEMCEKYSSNIDWICSDGAQCLLTLENDSFELLLLDGSDDPEVTLKEFTIGFPKLRKGGICIVDNSGVKSDGSGTEYGHGGIKGHLIWRYCVENHIGYEILRTQGINQLRVDKIV